MEPPPFDELPDLLHAHDADADGRLTLAEFKALLDTLQSGSSSRRSAKQTDDAPPAALRSADVSVGFPPAAAPAAAPPDTAAVAPPPETASAPAPAPPATAPAPAAVPAPVATVPEPAPPVDDSAVSSTADVAAAAAPASTDGTAVAYASNYSAESDAAAVDAPQLNAAAASFEVSAPIVGELAGEGGASNEPAVEAVAAEAPAVEAPAVEAPAVEAPAVEAPSSAASGGAAAAETAAQKSDDPLPEGWEAVDDEQGRTYYWHYETDTVLWTRPTSETVTATAAAAPPPSWPPAAPATEPAAAPAAADAPAGVQRRGSVKQAADFFVEAAEATVAPAVVPAPAALSLVEKNSRIFANGGAGAEGGEEAAAGPKGALVAKVRQLHRAGVDQSSEKSEAKPANTQHKIAMAALERKVERANTTKVSSSQHAAALRGLQQAENAAVSKSYKPLPNVGNNSTAENDTFGVKRAKAAFSAQMAEQESGGKGSQREEALRKLHGKGVVPARMAFGQNQKEGTQRFEAMKAFQNTDGIDVSTSAPPPFPCLPLLAPLPTPLSPAWSHDGVTQAC